MGKTDPADLESILSPVPADAFLRNDYGQRFVYVPGEAGKFAGLMPWDTLNRILEQHRLDPPRLRLTREGKPVPPDSWLSWGANRRKSGNPIPRVNATAMTKHLREGATLVLDAVDELHRPVTELAMSLERMFRVRVQVNLYAGWRTSHGFDLHWDDHDVFILQIAGRKHWQIHGVTRPHPLARDIEAPPAPPQEPVWEGMLRDGDLLYIPRGWWHVATPLDEPTLHLTVGVNNPTGADFLAWYIDRLRTSDDVRSDIPHLSGPEAMAAFAGRLRAALLNDWRPELVNEYLEDTDARSRPRPHFNLPFSATPALLPDMPFRVRWAANRKPVLSVNGDVAVVASGRRWRFAPAAEPVLNLLAAGRAVSPGELQSVSGLDAGTVHAFLQELAEIGLVVVC